MKIKVFIIFLGVLSCLSCTEECGVTSEPTLSLQFSLLRSKPIFTKIRAVGSTKDIPSEGVKSSSKMSYGDLHLPLNLNESQTTYIFEQQGRTDTLTVFYTTNVQNFRRCGYVLEIAKPTTGRTILSSFKRAEVQYNGYYSSYQSGTGGGINVQIAEL